MIVLIVVSRRVVPADSTLAFNHQELYALALEQQLITHYAYVRGDQRLANESIHPGHQSNDTKDNSGAIGHPIYVAYSLDGTPDDVETMDDHGLLATSLRQVPTMLKKLPIKSTAHSCNAISPVSNARLYMLSPKCCLYSNTL